MNTLCPLINVPPSDEVQTETFRRRFLAALQVDNPAPAALSWRAGRFDRGLRLADEIERHWGSVRGRRVLDVGAAHGGDSMAFVARGAECVMADFRSYHYPELIQHAGAGARLSHEIFDCRENWPLPDGGFDVVMALYVVEHVENLGRFYSEMLRVLKPGGVAVVMTGTVLKSLRCDPCFHLPLVCLLPIALRKWMAERVFGHRYEFQLSRHQLYSVRGIQRQVTRHGFTAQACKYHDSPLMNRLARYPMAAALQRWVRDLAFDFVLIRREAHSG